MFGMLAGDAAPSAPYGPSEIAGKPDTHALPKSGAGPSGGASQGAPPGREVGMPQLRGVSQEAVR